MSSSIAKPDVEPTDVEQFHAHDTVRETMTSAGVSAAGGVFFSAMQNAMSEHKRGALGVFTRTGGTIALMAGMGGTYSAGKAISANAREKEDTLNSAVGACAAGLLGGAAVRSVPMMFGTCASLAAFIATYEQAGRSLAGAYGDVRSNSAHTHGVALEGAQAGHEHAGHGDTGWRSERERRRAAFFKKPDSEDTASE